MITYFLRLTFNKFLLIIFSLLIISCDDSEDNVLEPVDPPKAVFTVSQASLETGETLTITNNSTLADSYDWEITFPSGRLLERSDDGAFELKNDEAGTMTIILKAISEAGTDIMSKNIEWIQRYVPTTVYVKNELNKEVRVYHDTIYLGLIFPFSSDNFEIDPFPGNNKIIWEIDRLFSRGCNIYLGQEIGGYFEEFEPEGTWGVTIDNIIENEIIFGLEITNRSSEFLHWTINKGNEDEWSSLDCAIGPDSYTIKSGYFKYHPDQIEDIIIDNVYPVSGDYLYWDITEDSLENESGLYVVTVTDQDTFAAETNSNIKIEIEKSRQQIQSMNRNQINANIPVDFDVYSEEDKSLN